MHVVVLLEFPNGSSDTKIESSDFRIGYATCDVEDFRAH